MQVAAVQHDIVWEDPQANFARVGAMIESAVDGGARMVVVTEMWSTTLKTLEELTPPSWHLVFTMYLDGVTDTGALPRIERTAEIRGSTFVPVVLTCDTEENARRIVSPERTTLMKSIDPEEPRRLAAEGGPYDPGHPHQITLDTTATEPGETAAAILAHAAGIQNP